MKGICKDCKKIRELTKHSKLGGHIPPFVYICKDCHNKRHNIKESHFKKFLRTHSKYQPGTPKWRRKK